ncbi:MAG: MetQ/NlpA family ABC transporter substrate-binding protein [Lachnospiraceae bacterium]|nr:MetQ/NlpA family ABC transporter substrate-binding protein [Lachnospiraceae bacterium]
MKKKIISAVLSLTVISALIAGCGSSASTASTTAPAETTASEETSETAGTASSEADTSAEAGSLEIPEAEGDDTTISIGVTPVPHEEIVENVVKPALEAKGWTVDVVAFNDYVQPNTAVDSGDLDANYFQTTRYMEEENNQRGLKLVSIAGIHLEPMGLYSKTLKSIDELKDGATIAIPNDGSNESRAIQLLADNGLLTVDESVDLLTPTDITENPHNFEFIEQEAASLPRTLDDVDAAVINGNYAMEADFNPSTDALIAESADTEASKQYINDLVVNSGNENTLKSQALKAALQSQEVKDYINDNYSGSVIAAF